MRRITLSPSANERRDLASGRVADTNPMMIQTPRKRHGARGVTLERDHPFTLPEAVALRNVLRRALAPPRRPKRFRISRRPR